MYKKMLFLGVPILIIVILVTVLSVNKKIFTKTFNSTGVIHEILLKEESFTPSQITINLGDTVKFTSNLNEPFWPASDLHPTHGIYPEFDPGEPVEAGSSWQFTFDKKGDWKFHDHLNPYFRGIIIVK